VARPDDRKGVAVRLEIFTSISTAPNSAFAGGHDSYVMVPRRSPRPYQGVPHLPAGTRRNEPLDNDSSLSKNRERRVAGALRLAEAPELRATENQRFLAPFSTPDRS
jgi:hypothetical protein